MALRPGWFACEHGLTPGFVQVMEAAVKIIAPAISARRTVKERMGRFYVGALGLQGEAG